jgi:hypothetical protein
VIEAYHRLYQIVWGSRSRPKFVTCGDRRQPTYGCPKPRALALTWCFTAAGVGHDPPMSVRLIYQMFTKLLSWMVLHTHSDTANEIEILVLRHQLAVLQRGTPRETSITVKQ